MAGVAAKLTGFFRHVFVDWIVDHLKAALTALLLFVGYSFGVAEDWFPDPIEIVRAVRPQSTAPSSDVIVRDRSVAGIEVRSDGSAAGKLGESVHLQVIPRIAGLDARFQDVEIRYGLIRLRSSASSKSAVDLLWSVRADQQPWITCRQNDLRFERRMELERSIARTINNSLKSTELKGRLSCS